MSEDLTAAATAKDLLLRSLDLSMLNSAHRYDLNEKNERNRSVTDLSRLFFQLANILNTDLFVECGAKDASSSRRARRRLDPKRIVAFEANPYTYRRFKEANAAPVHGVEYLHTALSDHVGTVTFNVLQTPDGRPRSDGQASLLKRQDQLETGFTEATVDATTLDHFFAGDTSERIALWIDVEGAARNVLQGGTDLLSRASVLIIEVEDRRWWGETQWLRADVASFLFDHGMLPVARDFQSRYQYNMIFVRSPFLDTDRVRWALTSFHSAGNMRPTPPPPTRPGAGTLRRAWDARRALKRELVDKLSAAHSARRSGSAQAPHRYPG